MKKYVALIMLAMGVLSVTAAVILNNPAPTMPDPPANAVGAPNSSGPPTVYVNKLVNTFQEGGTINVFEISYLGGEWNLVRKGTLDGKKRTEMIPIVLSGGFFRFIGPVWFYVCDLLYNVCPEPPFCTPNPARTSCICTVGGANCNFGGSSTQIYETEVIN